MRLAGGPKRGVVAAALAVLALTAGAGLAGARDAAPSDRGLPRAELDAPHGIDRSLRNGPPSDRLRVGILMADQPLLEAAARPGFQRRVAPQAASLARGAAVGSPERITKRELRLAARLEAIRERAIHTLVPVLDHQAQAQRRLAAALERVGGRVIEIEHLPSRIVARVSRSALGRLAPRSGVQAIEPAPPLRPALETSAPTVGAPAFWQAGHTGGTGPGDLLAVDVGMGPEEPDPTHPAFQRDGETIVDNPAGCEPDSHGTETAGVVASGDGRLRGVAHGVDKVIGGGASYALGLGRTSSCSGDERADDIAEVFSISFSCPSCAVDYPDLYTYAFNLGTAIAAGNDGEGNQPYTYGGAGDVNNLVVAGIDHAGTVDRGDDSLYWSSAAGPTVAGRKQPDITAPAAGIDTTRMGWDDPWPHSLCGSPDPRLDGTCLDFTHGTGTSFSTPHVGGGLALLAGSGIAEQKAQRAILINSARPWCNQEAGCQTHWQPDVGWGVLDLERALAERANWATDEVREGESALFSATADAQSKATLVWDWRGISQEFRSPGDLVYALTNLELRQHRAPDLTEIPPPADPGHGGGPDALDTNDTVEQVRSPAGEQVIYRVEAASTVEGADAEPFAVATSVPLRDLAEPEVKPIELAADDSPTPICGQEIVLTARAQNGSADFQAENASLTLALPDGVELGPGSDPATQPVSGGTLGQGETSSTHSWTVIATRAGAHELTVTGSAELTALPERWRHREEITISCRDAVPAEVRPVELSADPVSSICGDPVRVTARLANSSPDLVAEGAEVTLELPPGASLASESGPATQTVSDGVLERETTSAEHSWTVELGNAGDQVLEVVGSWQVGGETTMSAKPLAVSCTPPTPPEVTPTQLTADPEPSVCGEAVTVGARLENPSPHVDADGAEVALELPAGASFADGSDAATQTVSAGVLEAEAISEPHTWSVALHSPGQVALTVVGSLAAGGEKALFEKELLLSCQPPASVEPFEWGFTRATPYCDEEAVLWVRLRNPSSVFRAEEATVSIDLAPGLELVSGAASQAVGDGSLAAGEISPTHSWTVRPTEPGEHSVSVTGHGTTHAHTPHPHSQQRQVATSIGCELRAASGGDGDGEPARPAPPTDDPPVVRPTGISLAPKPPVQCGTIFSISARLVNDSQTDAVQARVTLSSGRHVALARGAQTQPVSGGTLAAGNVSDAHTWQVRQIREGKSTAYVVGIAESGSGASYLYSQAVDVSCQSYPAALEAGRLKSKRGRIIARGSFVPLRRGTSPAGRVKVVAKRSGGKGKSKAVAPLRADGSFRARLRPCRPGRWKLRARYTGDPGYSAPAERWRGKVKLRKTKAGCAKRHAGRRQ